MTETLAILAKNKIERLSKTHQNVTGATEISKSSCIYRLYHAFDYVPSTYLLDVMTETLAMLALLLAIMHYCRRSTALSICHGVARLISPKQAMRGSRYPYLPLLPKR